MKALTLVLLMTCAASAQDNGFFATAPWMQPDGGGLIGDWNQGGRYSVTNYGAQATGIRPSYYVPAYRPYHYDSVDALKYRLRQNAHAHEMELQAQQQNFELQNIRDEIRRSRMRQRW